jgi:hypothetical protein
MKSSEFGVSSFEVSINSQRRTPNSKLLLKAWRDQIIRDLAEKGQITKAHEYTQFLDEIAADLKRGQAHNQNGVPVPFLTRNSTNPKVRSTMDDVRQQWLANADRFIQRLRKLESHGRLTEQNILKLLKPATMVSPYVIPAHGSWLPEELLRGISSPRRPHEVMNTPRSELRTKIEEDSGKGSVKAAGDGFERGPVRTVSRSEVRTGSFREDLDLFDANADAYKKWLRLLKEEKRWREGVDFEELFENRSALVLGDTHHGFLGVQRGLAEHIQELAGAGATHLALEIPSNLDPSDISQIAQQTHIPHRFKQLVEDAQALGMRILFIDMPDSEKDPHWFEEETAFHRGVYMGNFIAKAISEAMADNPKARIVVMTGYGHIENYSEIPEQLYRHQIPHRLLAVVSEGQHAFSKLLGIETPFIGLAIASAVSTITEKGRRYGFVDLRGRDFPVEGIIHFPRPQPEAPTAQPIPPQITSMGIEANEGSALRLIEQVSRSPVIAEGQITKPLHLSFNNQVEPHARNWQTTNEEKILALALQLEGLTGGQRLYLAALLYSYARNTGRHSLNGSIVTIGFVPQRQTIELVTVDTAGYPYHPQGDYGSFMQNREISLRTLQEQFGFEDLFIEDVRQLPSIEISNNPENPLAIPKVVALVLAALKHPERIRLVGYFLERKTFLTVFYQDLGQAQRPEGFPVLTQLEVSDFHLNEIEHKFLEVRRLLDALYKVAGDLMYSDEYGFHRFNKGMRIWPQVKCGQDAMKALQEAQASLFDLGTLPYELDRVILNARKRLRYVNQTETDKLLEMLNQSVRSFDAGLKKVSYFFEKYSEEAQQTGRRGKKGEEVFNDANRLYDQVVSLREQIVALRNVVPQMNVAAETPALPPPVNEAVSDSASSDLTREALAPILEKMRAKYGETAGEIFPDFESANPDEFYFDVITAQDHPDIVKDLSALANYLMKRFPEYQAGKRGTRSFVTRDGAPLESGQVRFTIHFVRHMPPATPRSEVRSSFEDRLRSQSSPSEVWNEELEEQLEGDFRDFSGLAGVVAKKAPGTEDLSNAEQLFFVTLSEELRRKGAARRLKIDPSVVEHILKIFPVHPDDRMVLKAPERKREPSTFKEILWLLIEEGSIELQIDDLRDKAFIIDRAAKFNERNLEDFDTRLYPRFEASKNPMGVMSFLTIEEIEGKWKALIHISEDLWKEIWSEDDASKRKTEFISQLIVHEAIEAFLGAQEQITNHRLAGIVEIFMASENARKKGVSDVNLWYLENATKDYLLRLDETYELYKDPTIEHFYHEIWEVAKRKDIKLGRINQLPV